MSLKLTKMHALGNNYLYLSLFDEKLGESEFPELARAVSNVHTGVGSDGLIVIQPSQVAAVGMRIFNADGSEAESCGNGLRCVAKYAYDHHYVSAAAFSIETRANIVQVVVHGSRGRVVNDVTVDMGAAQFGSPAVAYLGDAVDGHFASVEAGDGTFRGMLVSMGNPHFVVQVEDASQYPVAAVGPLLEAHRSFPTRVNVEFVTPLSEKDLLFRVWERGSGITEACGTGACAAVAAGIAQGWLQNEVAVHLLGGTLQITRAANGHLLMRGEAVSVFEGEFVAPWSRS